VWQSWVRKYWWGPVAVIFLMVWMAQHDKVVKYRALSEQRIEEVQEAIAIVRRADSAMQARDSAAVETRKAFQAEIQHLRMEGAQARLRTNEAIDSLAETLTESQREQLAQVVAGFEDQLAAKDDEISIMRMDLQLAQTQIAEKDSVLKAYRANTDSLVRVWLRAERAGRPTMIDQVKHALPVVFAVGVLIFK